MADLTLEMDPNSYLLPNGYLERVKEKGPEISGRILDIFLQAYNDRRHILESMSRISEVNRSKDMCWQEIANIINAADSYQRTVEQLKTKIKNLKAKERMHVVCSQMRYAGKSAPTNIFNEDSSQIKRFKGEREDIESNNDDGSCGVGDYTLQNSVSIPYSGDDVEAVTTLQNDDSNQLLNDATNDTLIIPQTMRALNECNSTLRRFDVDPNSSVMHATVASESSVFHESDVPRPSQSGGRLLLNGRPTMTPNSNHNSGGCGLHIPASSTHCNRVNSAVSVGSITADVDEFVTSDTQLLPHDASEDVIRHREERLTSASESLILRDLKIEALKSQIRANNAIVETCASVQTSVDRFLEMFLSTK